MSHGRFRVPQVRMSSISVRRLVYLRDDSCISHGRISVSQVRASGTDVVYFSDKPGVSKGRFMYISGTNQCVSGRGLRYGPHPLTVY